MADQHEMMGCPGAFADFERFEVDCEETCAIPSEGRVTKASDRSRAARSPCEGDDLRRRDPWMVYGATRDIGEQRLASLKLRESEAELRTLVRGIPLLVWRSADMGQWTWSGPQWQACTGQSHNESLGLGWLDAVHPDDRGATLWAWMDATARGAIDVEHRVWQVSRNDYRWCRTRAVTVMSDDGALLEWLGTTTDVHESKQVQEHQAVLVRELQHRTRNLIGLVRSSAEKIMGRSANFEEFRAGFNSQLIALARVQDLLSRPGDQPRVTFDELLRSELSAMGGTERARLDGPGGVALCPSTLQIFAMAIHELATNALKYGALAQAQGRLDVRWRLDRVGEAEFPWLHVDWRESGVVMSAGGTAPRGRGSGRELIERGLPYQLGAKTSFSMEADGVHCTIAMLVSQKDSASPWVRAPQPF